MPSDSPSIASRLAQSAWYCVGGMPCIAMLLDPGARPGPAPGAGDGPPAGCAAPSWNVDIAFQEDLRKTKNQEDALRTAGTTLGGERAGRALGASERAGRALGGVRAGRALRACEQVALGSIERSAHSFTLNRIPNFSHELEPQSPQQLPQLQCAHAQAQVRAPRQHAARYAFLSTR